MLNIIHYFALFETDTGEQIPYRDWELRIAQFEHGWSGRAHRGSDSIGIRGWVPTRNEIIDTLKRMVDNKIVNSE